MAAGELKPPFNPKVTSASDLKNFEKTHINKNILAGDSVYVSGQDAR